MIKCSLLLFAAISLQAGQRVPDEFRVTERFLALASTFDVSADLGAFAVAKKEWLALTPTYRLEDCEGNVLATGRGRFFSWGTVVDFADAEGIFLGKIEEVTWRFIPWAEYRIYDQEDRFVALAKMNYWGTHFDLFHPNEPDAVYATIARPYIRLFRDTWTVQVFHPEIFEEGPIDPRLLILLAVFQTDKDNLYRIKQEALEQIRREQEELQY